MPYHWFSQRNRWFIWLVYAGLAALLVGIGYILYRNEYNSLLTQKYDEINAIADLKVSQILGWRGERLADARAIASDDNLLDQITQSQKAPANNDLKQAIRNRISVLKTLYLYDDILITDQNGNVLLSVNEKQEQIPDNVLSQISEAISSEDVVFGDFYECESCGGNSPGYYCSIQKVDRSGSCTDHIARGSFPVYLSPHPNLANS